MNASKLDSLIKKHGKLFLIYFIPATAFWFIWLFLIAWSAADSGLGKSMTFVIKEELQQGSRIMAWWLCHTVIMVALFVFSLAGIIYLKRQSKIMGGK